MMFAYSPTLGREAAAAMNATDTWSGTPVLVPVSAPALELSAPAAARTNGSSGRLIGEIDLAATPPAVRLARSYVRELVGQHFGAERSRLGDLELLTSEAMTNSVLHGRPRPDGTVMLAVLHIDRFVRVEITDGGPPPGRPGGPDEPAPMEGRSLALLKALAADFGTHRGPHGTAVFWFGIAVEEGWRLP
ncbi:ATP-binding protein [Actinomadura algeriensis]|uniref:Anti-sigma regulatory factor (Ser/Thr protein kinase) n=1 Tax=Actinomadura algeriensis TaxID=1679523 RepID=A0ABR9JJ53_9ACTN|nr:ATP-binding protein [Actinomadura algeriensis]MBE1530588.1 anti-sigma regulatory factor (Ser/Thr protein kinase) [Actinomadura algeriensis]